MNLQITAPLDEASVKPADEVARVLADARISDATQLLDALDARRIQLGLSNATLEQLSGLAGGHATKLLGPARIKSPTLKTLDAVLGVLALSIVLVVDPAKAERVHSQWRPRDQARVRQRALGERTVQRAKPAVLAELHRRAARKPWRSMTPREFLTAMAKETA